MGYFGTANLSLNINSGWIQFYETLETVEIMRICMEIMLTTASLGGSNRCLCSHDPFPRGCSRSVF